MHFTYPEAETPVLPVAYIDKNGCLNILDRDDKPSIWMTDKADFNIMEAVRVFYPGDKIEVTL